MQYWHMQMHPDDKNFAIERVHAILEHNKIIGVGEWAAGQNTIDDFNNRMQVNDIVAIKTGKQLIALVQVIGGAYTVANDETDLSWIEHRRPIRVLDWELKDTDFSYPRGTLKICLDHNAEATKTIKLWHERVEQSLKKRKVPLTV
ncbi:Uncharacterised protein [Oligella ureolytica]|nr:Uncharacterised protein [Oligella ureolytica]